MTSPYPPEDLTNAADWPEDNGTMPSNVAALAEAVVGHRIVAVETGAAYEVERWGWTQAEYGTALILDTGAKVFLIDTDDCCAFTQVEEAILNIDKVDHVITGVGTTGGFTTWHIYADLGDVVELKVGWSPGNPFYYGYGFDITVVPA